MAFTFIGVKCAVILLGTLINVEPCCGHGRNLVEAHICRGRGVTPLFLIQTSLNSYKIPHIKHNTMPTDNPYPKTEQNPKATLTLIAKS